MPGPWSRRALLASLATAPLAGCAIDGPETGSSPTPRGDPEPPASVDSAWPLPAHDAGLTNAAADAAGPTAPVAELWRVGADAALSAPVVADGTVYVGGDDGAVRALDARPGAERWRASVGAAAYAPRVMDDGLYVPTPDAVVALAAGDGTERWRTATPGRADTVDRTGAVTRATVLVAAHGVYWVADGGGTADGDAAAVVALAPDDGSERWRTAVEEPWSRRVFAGDGSVFVSTGTHARVPWTLAAGTGAVVDEPSGYGHDFLAERFYRDGTMYAASGFCGLVEATPVAESGHDWERSLPAGRHAVSGGPDRVYVGVTDGEAPGLHALSATDGTTEWTADVVPEPSGRPVVAAEGVLVRAGAALRCLDPADGTERWARPADGSGGRVVVADDLLYATRDDAVRAFRAP